MRRTIVFFIIFLSISGTSIALSQDSLKSEIKTVKQLTAKFNIDANHIEILRFSIQIKNMKMG